MRILSAVAAALLAVVHTNAAAEEAAGNNNQSKGGIVTVPMLRNPKGYTGTLTSSIGKLDRRQSAEQLYNAVGREYLIEIDVGTPAQRFNVTLDTGRYVTFSFFGGKCNGSTLWIPSTDCPAFSCPFTRYDPKASSSYNATGITFDIQYGIGDVTGNYATETVAIGGLTVHNQMVGLANQTADLLSSSAEDSSNGIMGLAFPGLNQVNGIPQDVPWVFNLVSQSVISEPVFSIYLNSRFSLGYSGEITFGGIDNSEYTGQLTYLPVLSYSIPSMNLENVNLHWTVGGVGLTTSTGFNMPFETLQEFILDTGTTLTYMPRKFADNIVMSLTHNASTTQYDALNGIYWVDCKLAFSSDVLEFHMATSLASAAAAAQNTQNITVPMRQLVLAYDATTPEQATTCWFGIAPMPASISLRVGTVNWVLGESVLRALYMVHDMGQARVGVASAVLTETSSGSSPSVGAGSNNGGSPSAAGNGENTSSGTNRYTLLLNVPLLFVTIMSATLYFF